MNRQELTSLVKEKARQLGFVLAGVALPGRPPHMDIYRRWIDAGSHATMAYLSDPQSIEKRADPGLILPGCHSILVLGTPYSNPGALNQPMDPSRGRIAAYAWGTDYHLVLPGRMAELVTYIELLTGNPVPNRYYTDTGPVLERDLAMQAGLGWIGKNTCLIAPGHGSYFFISEIFLGIDLEPGVPFAADHCGTCQRCMDACPAGCILPDRTMDANRCLSYLTIENKGSIPLDLRPMLHDHVFGCDICQQVCPWNIRFASQAGDPQFAPASVLVQPVLAEELLLTPAEFNSRFKNSPVKRAKRRGYLRNLAISAGNSGEKQLLPVLNQLLADEEPLLQEAAGWAIEKLQGKAAPG